MRILSIPRLLLPSFITRRLKYPGSTTFQLGVDLMNRPSFFRLIAFSGSAGYNFQTSPYSRHSLTVFKLTYNNCCTRPKPSTRRWTRTRPSP